MIASYNVHGGIGLDRRFAPGRIGQVLGEIGADIVALQELRSHAGGVDMLDCLRRETSHHAVTSPTVVSAAGTFGNGLLSRFPFVSIQHVPLVVAGREPRGAIDAVLDCDGVRLRVIVTHLGLRRRERAWQASRLIDVVAAGAQMPTVLLGDVNEWFPRGRVLRSLQAHFGESRSRRTFPSLLPSLALDRIWASPARILRDVRVHGSRLARVASDHLPLVASIEL
ncbi:MAG TPA: endonuclease/exonuclease/phosphatase family protein [Rudaea sp.]|nr:endonuclease/exonuclease/phosphatase family protein [Rudaea sp.]